MFTYYTRKEYHVQIAHRRLVGRDHSLLARGEGAPGASLVTTSSFPGLLALLFVMFERRVQTANYLSSGFEERLRFRFIYFISVAAQMFDQFPKFLTNIRGVRPRIF